MSAAVVDQIGHLGKIGHRPDVEDRGHILREQDECEHKRHEGANRDCLDIRYRRRTSVHWPNRFLSQAIFLDPRKYDSDATMVTLTFCEAWPHALRAYQPVGSFFCRK